MTCLQILTNSNSILKCSIIKEIGWELTQGRMHTVLDLQAYRTDSQNHQPFKQGLRQTSTRKKDQQMKWLGDLETFQVKTKEQLQTH